MKHFLPLGALAFCATAHAVPPKAALKTGAALKIAPVAMPKVVPFPLTQVRLLDGPFKHAQELDHEYLLQLSPDRFLHNVRKNAGLEPKAPIYGGWESAGVAGHTLGHYLSALSLMYQSTGDAEMKRRVDYIVDELALAQEKNGDGYVSAIPDGRAVFNDIKAGHGNGAHRGWVPWYTMHKMFAGLRDAYQLTGNAKAKNILIKLGDWAVDTTKNLSDEQWQIMLSQEHGGINETLADIYALTGEQKYLETARKFSHRLILDPLSQNKDTLNGLHANTQIAKVVGFERIYEVTGDKQFKTAARFFWKTVTDNRSYAIGGNSDYEAFFSPEDTDQHLSGATAETCNTYNMLKLTRHFFAQQPQAAWMDYYERALFNHILGSQDPVKGGFNYLNPLATGHFKVYSRPTDAMWCCVGTGIENHAKYGDTIYYHDDKSLYVNLFIASQLNWAEKGLTIKQETRFPDSDSVKLTMTCKQPVNLVLKIRNPVWAKGMSIAVNGQVQKVQRVDGYHALARTWRSGDTVSFRLPMALHTEALHQAPEQQALLYGPIVLAGDLGREGMEKINDYVSNQGEYLNYPAPVPPVLVSEPGAILKKIERVPGAGLKFRVRLVNQLTNAPQEVQLEPFARAHHHRYGVYWNVYSPQQWQRKRTENTLEEALKEAQRRDLQARMVDEFRAGEQQSEVDHNLQGENTRSGDGFGRKWRDAADGGWFSFDLKKPADVPVDLLVTYWGGESGPRNFDILVDGKVVATQSLNNDKPGQFWDVTYPLPLEMTRDKEKVTVRFQGRPGNMAGGVFRAQLFRRK